MLRHSTALNSLRIRNVRIVKRLNHVKTDNAIVAKSDNLAKYDIRDKLMKVSNSAMTRYNEIIGFDEIDKEYKRIHELQEDLSKCQSDRTNLQLKINHIQTNVNSIQSEIQDHKRGEPKYIELMKKEFETIQEKNLLEEKFEILDTRERDMFAHLQARINILHDKSRTHTRQWGIISTIIGALLGVVGTSISAYYRNNDIRKVQRDFQTQFQEQIQAITKDTQQIVEGYNKMIDYLNQYDITPKKQQEVEVIINRESWMGYFKRKSWSLVRFCTFQKS